jgi:recombinational DNA repair protein (RecF pathway)
MAETIVATLSAIDVTGRKEAQRAFIAERINSSRLFNKYGLTHTESNETIVKSMMAEMRNLVQAFFKGVGSGFDVKRCDACGTTDPALQYDRAHDRSSSRPELALAALNRVRPDPIPITQKEVMKAFIREHAETPLWYLCKPCHRVYDGGLPPLPPALEGLGEVQEA